MKKSLINFLILIFISSIPFSQSSIEGKWKMSPVAGALGVGPALGDVSWWANSEADLTPRACFFDDRYVFYANGSYKNILGSETWNEAYQTGVEVDGCGAPVAPHNGANAATWTVDETAKTITIVGSGAYLGINKVHNTGEDGLPVDNTCLLYTSPSPRDRQKSRMPSSA